MRHRFSRVPLLAVALMLAGASVGILPPAAVAQDDAARVAEMLAARDGTVLLAGPLAGELEQRLGFSTVAGADVVVEDFSATATFFPPPESDGDPWDFGFTFRHAPDGVQQIVVDSLGNWSIAPIPGGILDSGIDVIADNSPNRATRLDLVVEAQRALFGIDGRFITAFDLPPAGVSDIEVGTGFFEAGVEVGRTIPYANFQVWSLSSSLTAVETPFPASTTEPQFPLTTTQIPASAISPEDAERFRQLLESRRQIAPLAGPFNANLKEQPGQIAQSWANIDVADFQASVVLDVPNGTSDTPWSAGFEFRLGPTGDFRVAVSSLRQWYFSVGTGAPASFGPVPNLVTTPGGTNSLDLFVARQTALLGVNDELVAIIALPPDGAASDVGLASGLYEDQSLPARVTRFREFVVRPFDPDTVDLSPRGEAATAAAPERFHGLLADAGNVTPLVGPFAGRLVESAPGTAPLAAAGVYLTDFGATASFTNPIDPSAGSWDAGFQFWSVDDQTNRIVFDSLGDVYVTLAGQQTFRAENALTYDPFPGATNTFHLFVEAGQALVGMNGEFIAAIDVPAAAAADVLVGSAFFDEDFVAGRVTDYQDFQIWEIA